MEQVIWKEFPFYGNRYLVSNEGNVRGPSGTILKPNLRHGYKVVYITISHSKKKTIPVHKIVALTFVPNKENKPEIDHINGNKTDNRVENLRWVTHAENMNNPITLELRRKNIKRGKEAWRYGKVGKENGKSKPIQQIDIKGNIINTFESVRQAGIITKINRKTIQSAATGRSKTAGGFIWKYLMQSKQII